MLNKQFQVCFLYPIGSNDSGQRRATELIVESLGPEKLKATVVGVPVLDRNTGGYCWSFLVYTAKLLVTWVRFLFTLHRWTVLHWTIGQTSQAWLRDSFPIWITKFLNRPIIASIHGSNFMEWSKDIQPGGQFFEYLRLCKTVTVLGPKQEAHLLQQGLSADQIVIMPNCCEFAAISKEELEHKFTSTKTRPIEILFLSSLIDSKGYPVFLEAIKELSANRHIKISATLCGRLTGSQFASRFQDLKEAEIWIEAIIADINRSETVKIRWLKGAWGAEKKALYQAADIFCLPTSYKVEAQPLVLLEAASQGCALISTRIGEIPSTFSETECTYLDSADSSMLTHTIEELIFHQHIRREKAGHAWMKYRSCYTKDKYKEKWLTVLELST